MPYQYKREPLTPDEANRLAAACETHQERFIVWTLLDTGLRVSELAGLTREHIDWQNHRLMIYGKGGIYGTKSKRRIIPLTDRIRPLIDGHFAIHDTIGMTPRTIQRILKRIANKARINRPVSPHVLRHTFAVAAVQKGISLPALQLRMLFENSKRSGRSSLSEEVISMNKSEQCPLTMSPTNRTRSRTAVEQRRSVIVAVLHQHQNGLTTREIREAIGLSRSLTDSALSGLFTRGVVHKRGNRYVLAAKDDSREH